MLKAFIITFHEELAEKNVFYASLRTLAGLRLLLFPSRALQFRSMNLLEKLSHAPNKHDPLYFLTHNFYLSKRFNLPQRLECAMTHHEFEFEKYRTEYVDRVYRSNGALLWQKIVDGHHFTLMLICTEDTRHEGDLSVVLSVDGMGLGRMSFSYINASVFGLAPEMTILISRNQSYHNPGRKLFLNSFKQNAPPYFCLAAICGIAMASGFKAFFGINHDAQVSYEKAFDTGFRNSYSALWGKFEGVEVCSQAYKLDVPLKLRPLNEVSPTHRTRARKRRAYWNDIMQSTCWGMTEYLKEYPVATFWRNELTAIMQRFDV
jgi:uncharacterized protein VirK/YbjX